MKTVGVRQSRGGVKVVVNGGWTVTIVEVDDIQEDGLRRSEEVVDATARYSSKV